jgi:hypothetical protein
MHRSLRAVLCLAALAALAGCDAAKTCPAGQTACGGACVDLATDALHCGACDVACGQGSCSAGGCACDGGATRCPGPGVQCVDLRTDPSSCGTCGHACLAEETCAGGACVCPPARLVCDGGATCQTVHPNGLGQSYYDCLPLDLHTLDQARAAAVAWAPNGQPTESGHPCGSFCLCRTNGPPLTATKAAVWCYAGSNLAGFVAVTDSPNCLSAFCPILGQLPWH